VTTTETPERLHRDMFPIEAYVPHANPRPQTARAFITDRRIQVYVEDQATHASQLLVDEPITGDVPEPLRGQHDRGRGQLTVQTPSGLVYLTPATGCGCGSSLRYLAPPVER